MSLAHLLITGSGDPATATALRLFRAGFKVTILSANLPLDIHHKRTFSNAVFSGEKEIDQIKACTFSGSMEKGDSAPDTPLGAFVEYTHANRQIPVLTEEDLTRFSGVKFDYIFVSDARLYSLIPARIKNGSVIISIAGMDDVEETTYAICADQVYFGRVIYPFNRDDFIECRKLSPDASVKETVRAPLEGVFTTDCTMDGFIHEKQELGKINEIPILSPATGKISGLLNSGMIIQAGTVFAEICSVSDPRSARFIPGEALAVAGGVLEAVLYDLNLKKTK